MKKPSKEKVEQYRREFSELLKELMAQTIGKMLQAELDEFLGYEKYKRSNNPNSRNGSYEKTINTPSRRDIQDILEDIYRYSAFGLQNRKVPAFG